jgi:hypothetical protein
MQYQVWLVFSNEGKKREWYVVNMATKQVQSVYKNVLEAKAVCDKLNTWIKKEIA